MLESLKLIVLLMLISAVIVTIDQVVKKGRHWKLWIAGTAVAVVLFTVIVQAGPVNISFSPSGSSSGEKQAASEGQPGNQNPAENSAGQADANQEKNTSAQDVTNNANPTDGQQQKKETQRKALQRASSPDALFLPVDEAEQNPGFKKFRDNFVEAVRNKDVDFLKQHTSTDIRYSFGMHNGFEGFMKQWKLDTNPKNSKIWSELNEVLALGGSFNKDKSVFTAPYVFSKFPQSKDSFENVAVISANVTVHDAPNSKSAVVMGLSYSIVKLVDSNRYKANSGILPGDSMYWRRIVTPAGQEGFINEKYVRSPIDYRAQFKEENGTWKMVLFVSGD